MTANTLKWGFEIAVTPFKWFEQITSEVDSLSSFCYLTADVLKATNKKAYSIAIHNFRNFSTIASLFEISGTVSHFYESFSNSKVFLKKLDKTAFGFGNISEAFFWAHQANVKNLSDTALNGLEIFASCCAFTGFCHQSVANFNDLKKNYEESTIEFSPEAPRKLVVAKFCKIASSLSGAVTVALPYFNNNKKVVLGCSIVSKVTKLTAFLIDKNN